MINITEFRLYWEGIAARIDSITGVLPVTIDREMGKKIQSLPAGSVTLFVFPPLADSTAHTPDAFRESNRCVVFVMRKYNPAKESSFELLEQTQPAAEAIKGCLLNDRHEPCRPFRIDVSSIETAPETELYGTFAGWSIAFNVDTDGL